MRYTLLEATQLILSSMGSDEVDSISDTIESADIALLLKSVFYDCATELGLPQQETLVELNASGSSTRPVLMTVPTNVQKIMWLKYDKKSATDTRADFQQVNFLEFDDFLRLTSTNIDDTVDAAEMTFTANGESHQIVYRTDNHPTWFTAVEDNTLLFDSIDLTVDTTLQKSKTMCWARTYPAWTHSDNFYPPLEPAQFSYFINKAKVRAFNEKKQTPNQEAAIEARRQKIVLQKKKTTVDTLPAICSAPRYGRK
jgi:hypothetical protein